MEFFIKRSTEVIFLILCFIVFVNTPLIAQTDVKTLDTELNKDLSSKQEIIFNSNARDTQDMLSQVAPKWKYIIKTEYDVWLDKMIQYIAPPDSEKYNPDKYFIPVYVGDEEEMNHRMKLYTEVFNLFAEYKKAEVPDNRTEELEKMAMELEKKLNLFKKELLSGANRHIRKAEREIRSSVSRLSKNMRLKPDEKPFVLNELVLNNIAGKIKSAENLLPGDPRIVDLNNKFDALKNEQSKWREKMIEDTRMLPDKFHGAGSEDIKNKAEFVVKKEYRLSKVLRVNIINSDWKEEKVIEFTDIAQTAVRYRVTRSLTAQVAASYGVDCFLYSVNIAKDRLSTGGWTDLYGHIMFTDKILEENIEE